MSVLIKLTFPYFGDNYYTPKQRLFSAASEVKLEKETVQMTFISYIISWQGKPGIWDALNIEMLNLLKLGVNIYQKSFILCNVYSDSLIGFLPIVVAYFKIYRPALWIFVFSVFPLCLYHTEGENGC